MTQLSTFGGVVVPSPTESSTIPADFLLIVNQFTGTATTPARANAIVSSQAERDSNYAGYPAGGLVICPPTKTIWMSLGRISGVQSWQIVYEDTGWVTDGFTFSDNFGAAGTETRVRRITDYVCLRVGVTYNGDSDIVGGSVTSSNPGNIVDTPVLTAMPDDFKPSRVQNAFFRSTFASGSAFLNTAGLAYLADMHPSSKIQTGQGVTMQFTWMVDR